MTTRSYCVFVSARVVRTLRVHVLIGWPYSLIMEFLRGTRTVPRAVDTGVACMAHREAATQLSVGSYPRSPWLVSSGTSTAPRVARNRHTPFDRARSCR